MARRKRVSEDEIKFWFATRDKMVTRPATRADIIAEIKRRNWYRWLRLRTDYAWLQRQMKNMGYNPDDAKELL